jgi:hypothetical protein
VLVRRRCPEWLVSVPQTYDDKYFEDVVALGKEMMGQMEEGVRAMLGLSPAGATEPTEEQLAAFFFQQQEMYPPEVFVYPDGTQLRASPWILALEYCENGKEWLNKFNRFIRKNAPPAAPPPPTEFAPLGGS